jgi:hypothetical protein
MKLFSKFTFIKSNFVLDHGLKGFRENGPAQVLDHGLNNSKTFKEPFFISLHF